jgi:hypothetical protein
MVPTRARRLVGIGAVLTAALVGCGAGPAPVPAPPAASGPEIESTGLGTACELPVTFRIPVGWESEPIDTDPDGEWFSYYNVGPFLHTCDVSGRPAGAFGDLYVAVAPASAGDPRAGLASYLAEAGSPQTYQVRRPYYTDLTTVNGLPAAEARFTQVGEDGTVAVAVCVVAVPGGLVLVRTSPDHWLGVPAIRVGYELALSTIRSA